MLVSSVLALGILGSEVDIRGGSKRQVKCHERERERQKPLPSVWVSAKIINVGMCSRPGKAR